MYDTHFPRFSHKLDSIAEEILLRRRQRKEREEDFRRKLNEFRARFRRVTCNRLARLRFEGIFIRKTFILERLSESANENKNVNEEIEINLTETAEAKSASNDELLSLEKESSQLSLPLSRGPTSSSLGRRTPHIEEDRRPYRTPTSGRSTPKLTKRSSYSPLSSFRRVSWKMQMVEKVRTVSRENTLTLFTPLAGLNEQNQLRINPEELLANRHRSKAASPDVKLPTPVGKKWRFAVGRAGTGSPEEIEKCVCDNCGSHQRTSKQKMKTASTTIFCAKCFQQRFK